MFRRADVEICYTLGFHPKPNMSYGPALGLGVPSFGELFEVRVDGEPEPAALLERLNQVAPEGLSFLAARRVGAAEPGLAKIIAASDFLIAPSVEVDLDAAVARFRRVAGGVARATWDRLPRAVAALRVCAGRLPRALEWPSAAASAPAGVAGNRRFAS